MQRLLFIFGTRPEAIKLAPLIKEFQKHTEDFECRVCISAQHREMLDQVVQFFQIEADYDLNIMKPGQTLFEVTADALRGMEAVLDDYRPHWVFVQGDTTTTFAGALAAYYKKSKVAHIEAGLRSFDKYAPFPEEMNRTLTSRLADLHFAPTDKAKRNLIRESVDESSIHVVGNTVIDPLLMTVAKVKSMDGEAFRRSLQPVDFDKKLILVTGHRRESFGRPFKAICRAIREIADTPDIEVVYPVHLNPNVRRPVFAMLGGLTNVHLIDPLDYPTFVWLMSRSYLILTDSGGVQEEAPSLGKPVLVMREVTERTEGIEAGTCRLVGARRKTIVDETMSLLNDRDQYQRMATARNPYGDGKASERVASILRGL